MLIPIWACSKIARESVSRSLKASSARLRSVMSSGQPTMYCGSPRRP